MHRRRDRPRTNVAKILPSAGLALLLYITPAKARAKPALPATSCNCVSWLSRQPSPLTDSPRRPLVDGTRVSSAFGPRINPVLSVPEFHEGNDVAAAFFSPIHALAGGVIKEATLKGTYGLFVSITHGPAYSTAYAHMAAIAPGIRPGVSIAAGEVIGFVGSTGASTGNHCHVESRVNGHPVDPDCHCLPSFPRPGLPVKRLIRTKSAPRKKSAHRSQNNPLRRAYEKR